MEYKLKKSEFYRVAYLVAGILMFLFLFGIFNLSSFASSGTFHGWYAQENVQNESYISFLQNFNSDDFQGMSNPAFDHSWSFTITKSILPDYSSTNLTVNFLVHVVTSEGDMVIGTFLFPSGSGQPLTNTFTGSGTCFGVPSYAYLEVIASTEWARIAGNYSIDSWTLTVNPINFDSPLINVPSDYSSYSYVTCENQVRLNDFYGGSVYPVGSPINYSVNNINDNRAYFINGIVNFSSFGSNDYVIRFSVSIPSTDISYIGDQWYIRFTFNGVDYFYTKNDFTINPIYVYPNGDHMFLFTKNVKFSDTTSYSSASINMSGIFSNNIHGLTFSLLQYKGTISDYMSYVQNQWNNISPNVAQTNSNIADSVSTVGSASTYESAQFTSFDNLVTQTGVDSFSLSTVSTPLLWVGGLITTCYNNLPSAIQYLLMFVGVFGLIVIILNSGSRVIRRFGGDS